MIYIQYDNLNKDSFVGVKKKISAQCKVFRKAFGEAYYTMFAGQTIYLLQDDTIVDKAYAITRKMCNEAIMEWLLKYNIKRTYIRYSFSDIWFVDFLKELKDRNIKSILEFPSIPYDKEDGIRKPIEDKYYRKQLHQYIDCCTTYSNFETVFNIPCVTLVNGVDIVEQKEKQYRKKDGNIVLLAVASFAKWHGYERIIKGIRDYYDNGGDRNIIFRLVGNGGQIQYYKRLVDEYALQEHVFFHGKLRGTELDTIYDTSDIAVGSLGFYKIGTQSGAPIKLREYCARGIPFVYGYEDISFNESNYFAYQVSNNETPINILEVINFYLKMYDGRDFIGDMRKYTLENLTWNTILQPVIDYLS